jgi:uncharacterized membrane protein HdeD (DUF308 family)
MTKYNALFMYAILLMISGFVLIGLVGSSFQLLSETFFFTIILSAIFASVTAFKCRPDQVPLNYHAIHSIGLALYGLSFLMLAKDKETFYLFTVFYLLYYGIAELIFGIQMLLQKDKMLFRIIAIRLIIGFVISITVIGLYISLNKYIELDNAIKIIGVLFILAGVNLIFFKTVLKSLYQKEHHLTFTDAFI